MPLKIYNSLTKQKEEFKPLVPGEVKMYVCGPTVYDEPHIGHLRSAYVFEVIRNYLKYSGYKVKFVRNVTDVDDKIIEKARENKGCNLVEEVKKVSDKYYQRYKEDLSELGIAAPDVEPKATEHISEMKELIVNLIKKDAAYSSEGDIYFKVGRLPNQDYGQLSHQNMDAIFHSVRIDPSEKKQSLLDFALWKKAKEGEPSWPSPWGEGRPGWHIECSAMSMKYLGETFDIHGGGRDLIFPHHENEIAQSEGVTGKKPFASYWIHHGLITINNQKMSKSLGNYITLKSILEKSPYWGIEELKVLFVGTHYSAPLDYSDSHFGLAKSVRDKFCQFYQDMARYSYPMLPSNDSKIKAYVLEFEKAMSDDFNTPGAIAVMHEMIDYARRQQIESIKEATSLQVGIEILKLSSIFSLKFGAKIEIGDDGKVKNVSIQQMPVKKTQSIGSGALIITQEEAEIRGLIKTREEAKKKKDYKTADSIRNQLNQKGIMLKDFPDGTTEWRAI